ncbi:hypothetical protein ACWDAQ_35320, partial [Streptomyces sp. NPDC001139]
MCRKSRRPPEGRAPRRLARAIARRRSALIAELFGRFGNAASARALKSDVITGLDADTEAA